MTAASCRSCVMAWSLLATCVVVGLGAQSVAPQQIPARPVAPPPPSRDVSLPDSTGTSALGGTVTVDENVSRPVRRVLLTLNGTGLRSGRMTVTDDEGRFVFRDLPAGRFMLSGSRPGYVTTYFGARRPWRGPGTQIWLEPSQQRTDLAFKITRGAVIAGMVRDPNGQPQSGLRVQVLENRLVNGEQTWASVSSGGGGGQTDDRGAYRIYGLAPGTYIIGVGGTPLVTAARLTTDAEVQWALQQAQTAARTMGSMPGASSQSPPPEPGPIVGYAPLYFPGTTDPAAATTITIGPGEERTGVDLVMQFVPTARVEGVVTGGDGQPAAGVQLGMVPQGRATAMTQFEGQNRVTSDRNGRFVFQTMRPGQYTLVARGPSRPAPPPPIPGQDLTAARLVAVGLAPGPNPSDLWAQTDVSVSGRDITGITLSMQPGMTLSGRVAFEGARPAPTDASRLQISLRPPPNQRTQFSVTTPSGQVASNGTFTLSGIAPGKYLLSSNSMPGPGAASTAGWNVKSILLRGQDILDFPFEIQPNEVVSDVVVTFTDQTTDVSGRLIDGAGRPVADYFVLMFPTSKSYWFQGSRRMRLPSRTLPDGRFRIGGLPPGEYFMVALTEFDNSDLYDTTFLEQVAAASFKITLDEGEKKAMDLKIAGS